MRSLSIALASLSISLTAAAAPAKAPAADVCAELALPFSVPPESVTAEWCDADYSAWLESRASIYCAHHEGSAWCACYAAGFFD